MPPRATNVSATAEELTVHLADGRTIIVPLERYRRLLDATPEQRRDFRILGEGEFIHWPQIDEDLSVAGVLRTSAEDAADLREFEKRRREPVFDFEEVVAALKRRNDRR
jgi:hypothetical protein